MKKQPALTAWGLGVVLIVSGVNLARLTPAFAAGGDQLWISRYSGPGSAFDQAVAVAVNSDGSRVFVTGDSPDATGNEDYQTFAYDSSTGAVVWSSRYDSPFSGYDEASGLSVSPDGARVFVTGISEGPGTYSDWSTVALDAATGAFLWVMRERSHGWDYTYAVVASPDG